MSSYPIVKLIFWVPDDVDDLPSCIILLDKLNVSGSATVEPFSAISYLLMQKPIFI